MSVQPIDAPEDGDTASAVVASVGAGAVFLPYQARAIGASHRHQLLVVEKSRRIGLTWGFAGDDAVTAAATKAAGGDDVLYISYSFDMAREYISAVADFAKAFGLVATAVGEAVFEDQEEDGSSRQIKAFRIEFASGHVVQALTSAPRSLRGKQGRVRIDEAAFVDNLAELLKAALALLIWGGRVVVISTHNGVENPFNKLIQEIRAGEREGHVERITFDDAIADGLYERVALIMRSRSQEPPGKDAWIAKIRAIYGSGAEEELDVIPSKGSGTWLSYDQVERAERSGVPVLRWSPEDEFGRMGDVARRVTAEDWCERNIGPVLLGLDHRAAYGIGGDFARSGDLTDIWLLQESQDRSWTTPLLIELRNMPITEQQFILEWLLRRLRRWSAWLDQGNLGFAIAERMQQLFGPERVTMVAMREAFWLAEGPPLKARFEDGRIGIPRDRDVASDLRGVQVRGGTPFIPDIRLKAKGEDAPKGARRHFDAAVALALASAALRSGASAPFEAEIVQGRATGSFAAAETVVSEVGFGAIMPADPGPNW